MGDLTLDLDRVQDLVLSLPVLARATPNSTVASSSASNGMATTTSPLAHSGRSAQARRGGCSWGPCSRLRM
jgi:hypothetical protein